MGVTIERTGFSGMTMPEIMTGTAYMEEALAHTYIITPPEGVTYTGKVLAHVLRADDTAIAVDGTIDAQGRAVVTLIADCYHVAGRLQVAIYLTASDDSGVPSECIYACVTAIYRTVGSVELDSGTTIPTLAQMEAAYQACVEATEDARAAADNAVIYSAAQTLTHAEKAQARENINAQERIEPDGAVALDLSDSAAAYPTGDVGQSISTRSSAASTTYRRAAWVQRGCAYVISVTNGDRPASTAGRVSMIADGSGIILQRLSVETVAGSVVETHFTADADGLLWLCVDANATAVALHGGAGYGIVRYETAQNLEDTQKDQARRNIGTPLTPDASLIGRIATLYTDYATLNYRQVSVAGNHVSITKTSSSGSTFHGKSILGAAYSTELETVAISTTAARANRFREMYAAGAYAPLEGGIPFYNDNGTQYKLRMSYWSNGVGSSTQRHGLYLGTYNPDTDSVEEFGFYDILSKTVDGSTVYILPALREIPITTGFIEAVNANKNLMALLIVRSGGDSGNVCHFVWDIVPDRSHYVTTVSGATPTITAVENVRYECGTVTELNFTPCSSGLCEVIFTTGSSPTEPVLPSTVRMPDWWTGVEANRTYDIMVLNGTLGMVTSWAT